MDNEASEPILLRNMPELKNGIYTNNGYLENAFEMATEPSFMYCEDLAETKFKKINDLPTW